MKISLQWIKEFTDVKIGPDQLVDKIGAQLGAVENVVDLSERYKDALVVRVASSNKHPNADKLKVCLIDDGQAAKHIKRDANNLVQVVCGASNARSGMMAVWLPPGSVVPSSADSEPLILESREIRGEISNGMLASPKELGINEDHGGILEIDLPVKPGKSFSAVYRLDDTIIDIENKMFTHRPDCFGVLGIAREIAGINNYRFTSPKWYQTPLAIGKPTLPELPLKVVNLAPSLVPRFMVIAMKGIQVQPSSIEMQTFLSRLGVRPVNNVVDITNYMMLLSGQPLHAYDYDKVKVLCPHPHNVEVIVRKANAGEKLKLLTGKTVNPGPDVVLIAAPKEAIGIGGVMGGAATEVDESTTAIILECGTFNMYSIRRTSMSLGLFTDAVSRFNKGQSPWQNDRVLAKTVEMIKELMPGSTVASKAIDVNKINENNHVLRTTTNFINQRLGLSLSATAIAGLLENVEFKVLRVGSKLSITPPFWRTDIAIAEDIVEEVGRLYGYDRLPIKLPLRQVRPAKKDHLLEVKAELRALLANRGANELLTYSFVSSKLFENSGQVPENGFRINNAKSPDLHYYRQSLLPSLLDRVHSNIKAGFSEFATFEINQVHGKDLVDKSTKLPIEQVRLGFVVAAEDRVVGQKYQGAAYYEAKKYAIDLLNQLNFTTEFTEAADFHSKQPSELAMLAPFEVQRTAIVKAQTGEFIGAVGELKLDVRNNFKLPKFIAGFELDVAALASLQTPGDYVELPRFPYEHQDICLRVGDQVSYQQLYQLIEDTIISSYPASADFTITPVDIYQKPDDTTKKQITFGLSIASYDKTLTTTEVNNLLDVIAERAKFEFKAIRV
jgi:phenylalanyl-tRNA synthetase beta chain